MKQLRRLAILTAVAVIVLAAFHPGGRYRSELFWKKLTGQFTAISWTQLAVRMIPGPSLRAKVREVMGFSGEHWVQKLEFESKPGMAFQMHSIVDQPTATMTRFECHLSVLRPGQTPHAIHQHHEEEIIVPLVGEITIIRGAEPNPASETIGRGQLAYHAANQPHTVRNDGREAAEYVVLKWGQNPAERTEATLDSANFDFQPALLSHDGAADEFTTTLLFEGPTQHLGKLHSHASTLKPGGGYDPHSDSYDIAMVLLNGVVQTAGYKVEAPSIIFYAADQPHGIKNIGAVPAQYVVFEFHDQTTLQ